MGPTRNTKHLPPHLHGHVTPPTVDDCGDSAGSHLLAPVSVDRGFFQRFRR